VGALALDLTGDSDLEAAYAPILTNARAVCPGALIDVLVRMARLGYDLRDVLAELDLNPLLVLPRGEGVLAVDALIVPSTSGRGLG
jgi:hypothetical protein